MGLTWRAPLCLAVMAVLASTSWARLWQLPLALPWWHTSGTSHTSPRPLDAATDPKAPAGQASVSAGAGTKLLAGAALAAGTAAKPAPGGARLRLPGATPPSSLPAAAATVDKQLPTLHTLHLRNKCRSPIAVAVHMKDVSRGWVTRGWYKISPGATVVTPHTHNPYFKYFAVTLSDPLVTWGGDKDCRDCYYPGPSPSDDKFPFSATQKMEGGGAYLWELSCG